MSITAEIDTSFEQELDFRSGDGVEVALRWRPGTDSVVVDVRDMRAGERFRLVVSGDRALDAFNHPYAYRG